MTGIVQAVHEAARGPAGMRASADRHEAFVHAHRHALIEDETFTLPVLVSELLLIGNDPAVQLVDILEPVAAQ